MAVAVAVGLAGGLVGLAYIRLVAVVRLALRPLDGRHVSRALVGGVAVGVIAVVFGELTLFSGEHEISTVIAEADTMGLAALLVLAVGKMLAGAISLSTGFRGGRIFPALFIGGTLGMALHVAFPAWPAAAAAATGMAGVGAATFRMPLFLVTLLILFTSPDVVPLMLLAAIASWVVTEDKPEL
jgi:H+/Cl- antiporter ClcA